MEYIVERNGKKYIIECDKTAHERQAYTAYTINRGNCSYGDSEDDAINKLEVNNCIVDNFISQNQQPLNKEGKEQLKKDINDYSKEIKSQLNINHYLRSDNGFGVGYSAMVNHKDLVINTLQANGCTKNLVVGMDKKISRAILYDVDYFKNNYEELKLHFYDWLETNQPTVLTFIYSMLK